MYKCKPNTILNIFIVTGLVILCYYIILTNDFLRTNFEKLKNTVKVLPLNKTRSKDYNIWLIFTKVNDRSPLKYKFRNLLINLLNISTVPLKFNIIIDNNSRVIAKDELEDVIHSSNKGVVYTFYHIEECASKIEDIIDVMTPHFSSKPGTYYSGALFYISLGLYRIAPENQDRAVLLDCDLYFKKDVSLLFNEFERFKSTALFGLAPELTPVYRHILHPYKAKYKTTFGEFYHNISISNASVVHPRGFQGYNSGVVLVNLKALRVSRWFEKVTSNDTVSQMTQKYKFRGHLGDQDFYTLLGYEYPELIQTINCGYNRQLCTWWRDHGYSDVFDQYFKCKHSIVVLHGNCNTKIPN